MTTLFRASFLQDVRKLRDGKVRRAVEGAILNVEQARTLGEIKSLKRLSGHSDYYRIRIGDWRLGLHLANQTVTFVCCLHRREVYRFFP